MILVYGVGINDSKSKIRTIIKGKSVLCPYYTKWCGMLRRCYMNGGYDSYKDCSVSDEWLMFTNFREWMKTKNWKGHHLDKDIMSPGNKVYCAEHCIFIDNKINRLMSKSSNKHSGVVIDTRNRKTTYRVEVWFCKKRLIIGSFSSKIKAFAWASVGKAGG